MTKKLVLITAASLLVAAVAGAEVCNPDRNQLAWLFDFDFGAPALAEGASASDGVDSAVAATADGAEGEPEYQAYCQANCPFGTVSCTGTTCSAVNTSCYDRGHVTCDGATVWCATWQECICTISQCRQACQPAPPGCFAYCVDTYTCECDVICA